MPGEKATQKRSKYILITLKHLLMHPTQIKSVQIDALHSFNQTKFKVWSAIVSTIFKLWSIRILFKTNFSPQYMSDKDKGVQSFSTPTPSSRAFRKYNIIRNHTNYLYLVDLFIYIRFITVYLVVWLKMICNWLFYWTGA